MGVWEPMDPRVSESAASRSTANMSTGEVGSSLVATALYIISGLTAIPWAIDRSQKYNVESLNTYHVRSERPWRRCPHQQAHFPLAVDECPQSGAHVRAARIQFECDVDSVRGVLLVISQLAFRQCRPGGW